MKDFTTLDEARAHDPTVQSYLCAGRSMEEIVVVLATEKQRLMEKVLALELIAPKRIGNHVWRCPDHLVPASS